MKTDRDIHSVTSTSRCTRQVRGFDSEVSYSTYCIGSGKKVAKAKVSDMSPL